MRASTFARTSDSVIFSFPGNGCRFEISSSAAAHVSSAVAALVQERGVDGYAMPNRKFELVAVERRVGVLRGDLNAAVLAESGQESRGVVGHAGAGGGQRREEADGHGLSARFDNPQELA